MSEINYNTLPAGHVIEAAIVAFCDEFDLDDPAEVTSKVAACALVETDAHEIHDLISRAGSHASYDIVSLLRALMASDFGTNADVAVRSAVQSAGGKQLVITPDLLYVAAGLVALLMLKPPKSGEHRRVTIEENIDGRKKITIDEKVTYLNPTSALIALLERLIGAGGDKSGS